MSYAIIETGGKQVRVEPGRFYDIELLAVQPEENVTINSVLLVQHNGELTIGQPFVEGCSRRGHGVAALSRSQSPRLQDEAQEEDSQEAGTSAGNYPLDD
jgi:ribosomal protein L21